MSQPQFNAPPGWPPPPAGWRPDAAWRPDPSWPAAPAGWDWWGTSTAPAWPAPIAPAYQPGPAQAPTPPYSKALRVLLTCLMVLVPIGLTVFAIGLAYASVSQVPYATPQEFDDATQGAVVLVRWAYLGIVLVAYGFLAPKVSFRWFDTFFQLIPFYGIIWQFRIAWRIAGLARRDWPPRPDELSGHLTGMGAWPAAARTDTSQAPGWVGSLPPMQVQTPASQPGSQVAQPTPDRFG